MLFRSGLKLRNEKQIKIRQPLSTMYVSSNEGNHNAIETFGAVIMSEMNIGEVKELEDTSALESNFLTVNFKVAGRVLKNRANEVKAFLAELGAERQQELPTPLRQDRTYLFPSLSLR